MNNTPESSVEGESSEAPPPAKAKTSKSTKKRTPGFTADDMALAEHIYAEVKKVRPRMDEPKIDQWADKVRLMRAKIPITEIRAVFDWGIADEGFWRDVIQSPSSLRKNFDSIDLKMKKSQKTISNGYAKHDYQGSAKFDPATAGDSDDDGF